MQIGDNKITAAGGTQLAIILKEFNTLTTLELGLI